MTADFAVRIRVLRARQQIEDTAAALLAAAEGRPRELSKEVRYRIMLLLAGMPADDHELWAARFRLAHRVRQVYGGTSDVLHSRRTYVDVPEAVLQDWEAVVEELVSVTERIDDRPIG